MLIVSPSDVKTYSPLSTLNSPVTVMSRAMSFLTSMYFASVVPSSAIVPSAEILMSADVPSEDETLSVIESANSASSDFVAYFFLHLLMHIEPLAGFAQRPDAAVLFDSSQIQAFHSCPQSPEPIQ